MAKASTPIEKSARMLDLVPFLITHQGISITKLAEEFGVSVQEITSDLNTLWMCGLPGYTPLELIDLEFESGYVSIRNADVLNIARTFTSRELIVILLGLEIVSNAIPIERKDLHDEISVLKKTLEGHVGSVVLAESSISPGIRAQILVAISQRKSLRIKYHNVSRDEISERTIDPLYIYDENSHSYLSSFCLLTNSERTFRLDRILECQIVEREEILKMESAPLESISAKVAIGRDLRINAEQLQVKISEISSSNEVNALSDEWLIRSVMAGGGGVEVLEPSDIRTHIRAAAERALQLYR